MKIGNTNKAQAFTIAELMVVVIVLGVLAAVAIPKFQYTIEKSRSAEGEQILSDVLAAQELYKFQTGAYTTQLSDLELEFLEPKHFDDTILVGTIFNVATIERKTGIYTFGIDENGVISCYEPASKYCSRFGY